MKKWILCILFMFMACMLLAMLPATAWAAAGNAFIANITVGENDAVPCIFKVITEPEGDRPGTVQIGNNARAIAIDTEGELIIPTQVTNTSTGKTYDVTAIGNEAFISCSKLTGELRIPEGIISIGNHAFNSCEGFTGNLNIPGTVTSIGDNAFGSCNGFNGTLTISSGVAEIGAGAFVSCEFSNTLIIPNSVTSIGQMAFAYNRFSSIQFEEGCRLTELPDKIFQGCSNVTGTAFL